MAEKMILAVVTDDETRCVDCFVRAFDEVAGESRHLVTTDTTKDWTAPGGLVRCDRCGRGLFNCAEREGVER